MTIGASDSMSAAEAVRWKRFGRVKFTPWIRTGLDTLELPASGTASASKIIDVWGRYRNRWFNGSATDTGAIVPMYRQARSNLSAIVGSAYLARCIIAPDDDWSPYQMRRTQNAALFDSVAWAAATLGCPVIVTNSWGRDMDPTYLTNPKGWIYTNRRYTINAASQRGVTVNFVAHQQFTIMGSRLGAGDDELSFRTSKAYLYPDSEYVMNGQLPTYAMHAFWDSFYGPYTTEQFNNGDATNAANVKTCWSSTVFDNIIGVHGPASIFMLPAQGFGGQSTTTPNHWAIYCVKHVMGAAAMVNYAAGRTVMPNVWIEDLQP
jgi:hypothetical protein